MSHTHFAKFRGLANTMNKSITPTYMEKMIVRQPVLREKNLHPDAKQKWNNMTQEPIPLKFKLHELEEQTTLGDRQFMS